MELLNQLLRTMLGIISAQSNSLAVSREIARQMALALRGDWALVCGWEAGTNSLTLWGDHVENKSQIVNAMQCRLGPELARIMGDRKPVQLPSSSPAAKELSPLVILPEAGATLLFIPIQHSDRQTELLIVISPDKDRVFSEAERVVSQIFANHAAVILENVQLQGSVQRSATEIAELRREALTDMLTGLPNRRSFESRLEEELRRAARYSHIFSLVMIDLDNFKRINDQYGHHVGDVALQDIARCLRHKVRATDFLARFGGDEFVLVLPETTAAAAQAVCAKLYASMAGCAIGWGKADESLTFSYGIAEYPQDGQAASLLVGAADRAMYGEKGKSEAPALGV